MDHLHVAFVSSYLKDTALQHFTAILMYQPDHILFQSWCEFLYEFGLKFGIPNTQGEAKNSLMRTMMRKHEKFTSYKIQFESEAWETGWNWVAIRYVLKRSLPKQILEVLALAPTQRDYPRFTALAEQINWQYWESRSDNPDSY
ncbi:hypothetical protein DXG01_009672 [Tephrocybe rancida]|nr:hypothetical protein DXG01_009672 [Tephrocybe rancida]